MKKSNSLLKFICSLIDIMLIWSIPFAFVIFFWLCSLGSFSYREVIRENAFIGCDAIYSLISLIIYVCMKGGDDEIKIIQ
jgi:hypothetical protein